MSTSDAAKTEQLPLFPLGTVLTPGMPLALHVFEPRYRQLVADLLNDQNPQAPEFGVVALRQGWEVGDLQDVYRVGTTARVTDVLPLPDGRCDLSAVGQRRFAIHALDTSSRPYLVATVRWLSEPTGTVTPRLLRSTVHAMQLHRQALRQLDLSLDEPVEAESVDDGSAEDAEGADARALSYAAARLASLPLADRQQLLAAPDTAERLRSACAVLRREAELVLRLRAIPVSASTFRTGPATS